MPTTGPGSFASSILHLCKMGWYGTHPYLFSTTYAIASLCEFRGRTPPRPFLNTSTARPEAKSASRRRGRFRLPYNVKNSRFFFLKIADNYPSLAHNGIGDEKQPCHLPPLGKMKESVLFTFCTPIRCKMLTKNDLSDMYMQRHKNYFSCIPVMPLKPIKINTLLSTVEEAYSQFINVRL